MNNIDLGQVFTPKVVADYMVDLFDIKSNSRVLEPCFGEGVFLQSLLEKTDYKVDAIELDEEIFNKVKENDLYKEYKLYNLDFLSYNCNEKYDGIIMNPPYIRQEKINDLIPYGISKESLTKNNIFIKLPKRSNIYMYFILKAIDLLKDDGELIVIFPSTWLKSKDASKYESQLRKKCSIDKQIYVKGNVFGDDVLVEVVILKLIKNYNLTNGEELTVLFDGYNLVNINTICDITDNKTHISLKKYAKIRRGITTGNNKFFIGNFSDKKEFNNYIRKIISSPKDIEGYSTENVRSDEILIIEDNKENLPNELKKYINDSETLMINENKPKTLVDKIKKGQKWYSINTYSTKGIIFSYIIRQNMKFIMNLYDYNIRDNFYIIYPQINSLLLFGLLNNYYTYSRLESMGKQYGGGILKLQKYDLDNLKLIKLECLSKDDIKIIEELSDKLIKFNSDEYIYEISSILSKYENISVEHIIKFYNRQRDIRLMKGGKI